MNRGADLQYHLGTQAGKDKIRAGEGREKSIPGIAPD
jgi:hypothetical protein